MLYRDYLKNKYQNTAVKLANAEGVPCVLEYSKGKNMRNYEVYGNSVQDGTPTPESPVEIQSVGDLVTDTESEYYGKYDIPITVMGTRSETMHIYLDEPLRKVGDYADYIDFKNQKVVRKIEVLDDTGTKTISESFGTLSIPTEENILLPTLKTFKGTNVISVDTTVLPSNIKAKFIRT